MAETRAEGTEGKEHVPSVTQFSSNAATIIERKLGVNVLKTSIDDVKKVYETDRCIKWIRDNGFQQVCLQFPDEMLGDSVNVTLEIMDQVDSQVQVFVMGDTSYGSCCVDEVTAEHANADSLIHFGHACLSLTRRLPVLYVFGNKNIDVNHAVDCLVQLLPDRNTEIVLIYDVIYAYVMDELYRELCARNYSDVMLAELDRDVLSENVKGLETHRRNVDAEKLNFIKKFGRVIRTKPNANIDDHVFFYVGPDTTCLTNFIITFNKCPFYSYDPELRSARREALNVSKSLMKRYYMIEKTKDAGIIGILVGTLGVADYLTIITRLKSIIRQAGKKSYTLAVGKINVAKLANFPEIDVFVLVACPETSLIDSKEFFRPIVTPFEVEVACNSARTWTGDYVTDFRELLPGAGAHVEMVLDENGDEETSMSLITGSIRRMKATDEDESSTNDAQVVVRDSVLTMVPLHKNAAGEFLVNRSWTGLQQNLGQTPVAKVKEGRRGISIAYEDENELYN